MRKHCHKCDSHAGLEAARLNQTYIYRCHANIVDIACPIIIDEKYMGAVMAGQVQLEDAERHNLERIAANDVLEQRLRTDGGLRKLYNAIPLLLMEKIIHRTQMIEEVMNYIFEEAMLGATLLEINQSMFAPETNADKECDARNIRKRLMLLGQMHGSGKERADCHTPLVHIALNYVSDNISTKITLKGMSDVLHISESYFSRLFKKDVGESFSAYVAKKKIDAAAQLLTSTEKPVYEISEMLGFGDCGYFIKVFGKQNGVTPAVYRKMGKL
jgi:AraC-like DNA-binding protein